MKTVLITGCSSGFGMEAAVRLASEGYRVVATMRDPGKRAALDAAASAAKVTLQVVPLDVTDPASIEAARQQVEAEHGALFALVNNAGYGIGGFFEELSDREFRDQMETNFWGVLNVTRAFLPAMRQAGRGYVINVSSISGRVATPALGAYSTSKHALEGFSEALWYELRPFGVRVVLVEPGMFKTEIFTSNIRMGAASQNPASPYHAWGLKILDYTMNEFHRRAAAPGPVSDLLVGLLRHPDPPLRSLVGTDAKLGGLLRKLLPEWLFLRLIAWQYPLKP